MDLVEVKAYLEAQKDSKEVQELLAYFQKPVDIDTVKKYLESEKEGKKYLQAYADQRVTKGIDTWRENNLNKILDDEKSKWKSEFAPEDTPEQKRIKELEKSLSAIRADAENTAKKAERERRINLATKALTEKKVPADYAEWLVMDDDDSTVEQVGKYAEWFNGQINKAAEDRIKTGGREPIRAKADHNAAENGFVYKSMT